MNKKQLKQLRKKIKPIQVEWLRELLPEQTHMFGGGQLHLSYMTDKWIMKRLKKYPHINTYKQLKEIIND